jgi:hypothetical protein
MMSLSLNFFFSFILFFYTEKFALIDFILDFQGVKEKIQQLIDA